MSVKYSDFQNKILQEAMVLKTPVSGFFELTSRCNLQCKMCYICGQEGHASLLKRELTTAQWIDLARQARDAGALFVTLTGGEIFMRKDFFEIYEAFTQMGLIVSLYTNATLLTPEKIARLAKNPPHKISISVYGANSETYGRVTGHPEAYESTVSNIEAMHAAGLKLQLKTTVIRENSQDFQQLAEWADTLDLTMGLVNYISPRREGEGTDPLSIRLSPIELLEYEKNANNAVSSLNDAKNRAGEEQSLKIDGDVMVDSTLGSPKNEDAKTAIEKFPFRCTAGSCGFWLSWEGKLSPCGLLTEPNSEPMSVGFTKAWESVKGFCSAIPTCGECLECSYYSKCMTCPARLKLETGFFDKAAPYICEYTKARDVVSTSLK